MAKTHTKPAVRPVRYDGDLAYIPLTRGYEAVIDAADVHLVDGLNWFAKLYKRTDGTALVYAVRSQWISGGGNNCIRMHRVIFCDSGTTDVDHIDGDGLNNRRSNLRSATRAENQRNVRRSTRNSSGHKGVDWLGVSGKWRARIRVNGESYHLGVHANIDDAVAAYAEASKRLHGQFGRAS